jgi:hypothetical protein
MAQADLMERTLQDLSEDLSHCLTMIGIVLAMRRNHGHLAQLLRTMLVDLCRHVEHSLSSLPEEGNDHV